MVQRALAEQYLEPEALKEFHLLEFPE